MSRTSARTSRPTGAPPGTAGGRRALGRQIVGGFFLTMGGVHLGMVAADTEIYRHFADGALFAFVRNGWREVFMAAPAVWALLLMVGEVTLGVLLLVGGRAAPWGWGGVIGFHLLLLLFGFWAWVYVLPALLVLVTLARRDLPPGRGVGVSRAEGSAGRSSVT